MDMGPSTTFFIGGAGVGTLNVSNGGTVNSTSATIAAGGVGTLNVDGAGSTFNNTGMFFSLGTFGGGGYSHLNITHGGVVNSPSQVFVAGSIEAILVDGSGSTWNSGQLTYFYGGGGSLTITGGGVVNTSSYVDLMRRSRPP